MNDANAPARTADNGVRTPFWAENVVALKHGARSPRVFGELAKAIAIQKIQSRPDLGAYPEAVVAWATAEAQVQLLRHHYDSIGIIDADTGETRPLDRMLALERHAMRLRELLGLDPMSEAKLSKERAAAASLAVDLGEFAARGRAALAEQVEQDLVGEAIEKAQTQDARRKIQADLDWLI